MSARDGIDQLLAGDRRQGQRQAALALHALAAQDRAWMLARLPAGERMELGALLDELRSLGLPADPSFLPADGLASAAPPAASAPAAQTFPSADPWPPVAAAAQLLQQEPPACAAMVLAAAPASWRSAVLAAMPVQERRLLADATRRAPCPPRLAQAARETLAARAGEVPGPAPQSPRPAWWRRLLTLGGRQ